RRGKVTLYKPEANQGRGSFKHFSAEEGLKGDVVKAILEDSGGNIWFGMMPGGANRYHPAGFTYYTIKNGLAQNVTRSMFRDSRGAIWIGHFGAFTIYEPGGNGLNSGKFIQYDGQSGFGVDGSCRPRMEDSRGNVWMYYRNRRGVRRYTPDVDRTGGLFTHFTMEEGLSGDQITGMLRDKQGNVWFATNHGVSCYVYSTDTLDRLSGSFTHFTTKEGLSGNQVRGMLEDKRGNLWFPTDNGLSCFDPDEARDGISGRFTHFAIPKGASGSSMLEDSRGNLWFGVKKNGAYCFVFDTSAHDAIAGAFTLFTTENGLIDDSVERIFEDSDGNLWFATANGLSRLAPYPDSPDGPGRNFTHYTMEEGLSGNHIGPITEDKQKNIWISTTLGISLLVPLAKEDTSSKTGNYQIIAYNRANGLKQLERAISVILDSNSNRIWWRSNEGLTMLNLDQFQEPKASPATVRLNTIEIKQHFLDYRRLQDATYQGQIAFGERLVESFNSVPAFYNYPLNLSLPYRLNHLTFHFSAIDWQAPHNLRYRYIMEGLDDEWSAPSRENEADYRNLPPGSYTFKAQAIGAAQIESEILAYDFRILPPLWLTWWAYVIYAGSGLLILYSIREYELRRYRAQAENRRLRELDAYKTSLYTNIAHEFRTPLTIILGMVSRIKEDPKKWYHEGMHMIARSGKQLLLLVNQMLDLRKLDKGKLKLNLQQGDLVGFLNYLIQSFESFAASKNIQLHLLREINHLEMDFDPDQLTKIVNNLLSNAIKFTPEGGQVYVTIRKAVIQKYEFLEIRIQDTGIGIPAKDIAHIFDRFYQVDLTSTRKREGAGIGLALVKELVTLIGGEIKVYSQVGEGTHFEVQLPITRSPRRVEGGAQIKDPSTFTELTASVASTTTTADSSEIGTIKRGQKTTVGAIPTGDLPTILLIEDNRDVLTYLASCLEDHYQLEFAMNGKDGIDQAREIVPDIIISDIMMPEKDGYEVCATLKEDIRTSHIPIILLTAKADQQAKREGLKTGADAYLTKPFDKEELVIRIDNLLALRRKLQTFYNNLELAQPIDSSTLTKEEHFLQELQQTIEENLSNENFSISYLCRKMAMSRSQLHNKLKALTGLSASHFIRAIRLEKAKKYLQDSDLNISEVAYEVGFRTPVYFTQVFTEEVGVSPSRYRTERV
ncbi:MAG: response regulator, partial [Saprospiraceae bacterium]|nr:response regulator [Saprospiraceae bacterium]